MRLPGKGLKNGRHDFRFEVDKDRCSRRTESTEIKDGRCEVTVGADRSEKPGDARRRRSRATSSWSATAAWKIAACPLISRGGSVVKFSEEVHEYDGEVMWMLPGEDQVDLKQYIYESIVLSLPYQRVHPEGMCNPDMLERFRIVSDQEFASIEARAGGGAHNEGEWAKLAALRERMEAGEETPEKGEAGEKPRGTK